VIAQGAPCERSAGSKIDLAKGTAFAADHAAELQGRVQSDPSSPATSYQSNALQRITGGQIDPSGNVWLTNN